MTNSRFGSCQILRQWRRNVLFIGKPGISGSPPISSKYNIVINRAVAWSENPGGHIVLGGDNVPPLVEIGLTDLPKTGGARAPPAPTLASAHCMIHS